MRLKRFVMAAVLLGLGASSVSANGGVSAGQFAGQSQGYGHGGGLGLFRRSPVPAFQAAPWYLYWPYNAHFQTPAPMTGAYYGPPGGGAGGMVNPYYANPNFGYGGATAYPATVPAAPVTPSAPQAMPQLAPQTLPQTIPGGTVTPPPAVPPVTPAAPMAPVSSRVGR